jgi:N-acetylglucosaminyl-diphospho-decaprenol L-rhamnosyltransferase
MDKRLQLDYTGNLNLKIHSHLCDEQNLLPIAKARNLGAQLSTTEKLLFLDVDCIPSQTYISQVVTAINETKGLVMATPRYLFDMVENVEERYLMENSTYHPARPRINVLRKESHYEHFWSLCFAITKYDFNRLQCFDENYQGYGAEDTDFAFKARSKKLPFYLSPAIAFHQQHGFTRPPLDKIDGIVDNCNLFFKKWKIWPMDNYLNAFKDSGYIRFRESGNSIEKIASPTREEINNTKVLNEPYA